MTDDKTFLGYVDGKVGFTHPNGRVCWRTDLGHWVRDGEGVGADAGCPLDHNNADPVNLPPHYRVLPVECIDVTEHFNFCLGNAIKYIWRADHKGNPIQDLEKSVWYLQREIERRKREQ